MPTKVQGSKPTVKKNIVPKPKETIIEKTVVDVLADFNSWVEETKQAANAKRKSLNDSGRTDITAHKIVINNLLIDKFRGSKWT